MKTFITLDYELFFGKSGTVQNTIIKPTEELLKVLDKYSFKAVFFVDVGCLIRMKNLERDYPQLKIDRETIERQIKELVLNGHQIQLHIHSHWEDAIYSEGAWRFPMEHYRVHSFSKEKIKEIFISYKEYLEKISGQKIFAFRAGGWCIQPFSEIRDAFIAANLKIDSTVFKNGKNIRGSHYYNFKNTPKLTRWFFDEDPCKVSSNRVFEEIPISSYKVSPMFFWRFLVKKKLGGEEHKQYGDGYAVNNGLLQKLRLLFTWSNTVVSIDGYKARYLSKAFNKYKKGFPEGDFVIIGHPKAFTRYSLKKLDSFLIKEENNIEVSLFKTDE